MRISALVLCTVVLSVAYAGSEHDENFVVDELKALRRQLQQQELEIRLLKKQVEVNRASRQQYHEGTMEKIAFLAVSHHDFGPVTVPTNIPFPEVITNVGGGYFPHVFQAPVTGTYFFATSISSPNNSNAQAAIVHSMLNGTRLNRVGLRSSIAGDIGDANVALFRMTAGEVASVQLHPDDNMMLSSNEEYPYCTFSGFLLFT